MIVKERILQKAGDLYMRYGIRSVTMDEIALQCGASKKTIYQHFTDKDTLIDSVVREKIAFAEQRCHQNRCTAINAIDEMFKTVDMTEEIFNDMNPSVLIDLKKCYETTFQKIEKHIHGYVFGIIKTNLQRGIKEKLYRDNININILANHRIESMLYSFNPDFIAKTKSSIASTELELLFHYLFGIASPKGYKLILKYQHQRIKHNP